MLSSMESVCCFEERSGAHANMGRVSGGGCVCRKESERAYKVCEAVYQSACVAERSCAANPCNCVYGVNLNQSH